MKRYLLSFLFIAYLFLFGLFTISANILPTYATDCSKHWYAPWDTVPPGTLQCSSDMIQECKSDGSWSDYHDCSTDTPTDVCENFNPSSGVDSARCSKQALAPSPTSAPTSTPRPVPKCTGDFSPNEEQCQNNKVMICQFQTDANGNPIANAVEWKQKNPLSENTCTIGGCQSQGTAPNRTASCTLAQPTASPTPTIAGVPTATPTPDPTVKCTDPERKDSNGNLIQFEDGSIICTGWRYGGYDVKKCQKNADGTISFVKYGLCESATLSQGFGLTSMCSYGTPVEKGDTCNGTFTLDSNVNKCGYEVPAGQQLVPKPGINCGVDPATVPDGEAPVSGANACCFSALADRPFLSISCFVTLPGAEDFIQGVDDKINSYVNDFPISEDLKVSMIRKALKETPLCAPGAVPVNVGGTEFVSEEAARAQSGTAALDGTPLCQCKTESASLLSLCKNITKDGKADAEEQAACQKCMTSGTDGIWTAIGCINVGSENGFIQSLMRLGISLGGAFALLCNVYGAYLFQTSRGNPEGLKKAQDMITSCITGLLLIIFSVFILRLIGYNILRIPGFG